MTRTTGTLKRLGVMGIAVATIGTGLTATLPTSAAFAAPGDVITLTPETAASIVGGCQVFTVRVTNPSSTTAGQVVAGRVVDVRLTENPAAGTVATEAVDASFCTGTTDAGNPTTAPTQAGAPTNSTTTADTDLAEFTTGADGTFTFGVTANAATTINVLAFLDESTTAPATADNDMFDAGETNDTATVTFEDINAANTLQATPDGGSGFTATVITVQALVRDTAGRPLANIAAADIVEDITSGPNEAAAITCTGTNSSGVATCTYTAGAGTGTDQILIFVNQTDPDNNPATADATAGLDAGEPSDTASVAIATAPTGLQIDLTCGAGSNQARALGTAQFAAENCINPTSDTSEAFQAVVTAADGTDAGTDRDVVSGVSVTFTVTSNDAVTTDVEQATPATTTTDANGIARTTVTNSVVQGGAAGSPGEVLTVTATINGQDATGDNAQDSALATGELTSDSGTKTFRTAGATEARNITITPTGTNTTAGDLRQFSATVRSATGELVPGVTVTFTEEGPGRFTNGSSTITAVTNAQGVATAESTSTSSERGTQTVTATLSDANTDCELAAGNPANSTAGNCTATATTTFVSPAVTPGPDTNNPNPNPNPSDTAVARITLNVTSGRITAGNAPFLFGIVSDRNGNPLRNRDVTILQKRYNTTSFQELQTATDITTNERGEFRIRVQPDQQTAYVARATGTSVQSDAAGSTGRAVIVQVHNRINLATPVANQSASGRALQVRGDLDPNYASVRIGVAALRNGRFTYLTQGITAGDGSFVINVRNLPQGTFALVVYTSARQGNLFGSASRSVTAS